MNGRSTTFQVVALGPVPRKDGPAPSAQEINELLAEAGRRKTTATFFAKNLDDPNPAAPQYEFVVRVKNVDYEDDSFELIDQYGRWFMLDASSTSTKMSTEFDIINP